MEKNIIYLIILILLGSCFHVDGVLQSDGYYDIDDASIRLIIKHEDDSIIYSSYEEANSHPGHPCKKLEMTHFIDISKELGVSLRFWPDKAVNDNYGPFNEGGLREKISNIKILLKNQESKMELSSYLKGDSTMGPYIWTNVGLSDPF